METMDLFDKIPEHIVELQHKVDDDFTAMHIAELKEQASGSSGDLLLETIHKISDMEQALAERKIRRTSSGAEADRLIAQHAMNMAESARFEAQHLHHDMETIK